jgi:hypothetical protein
MLRNCLLRQLIVALLHPRAFGTANVMALVIQGASRYSWRNGHQRATKLKKLASWR